MSSRPASASQQATTPEWDRIAGSERFKDLLAIKKIFILPAFAFFCLYYFLLPVLVGFAPKLMAARVIGTVNLAYLFALSQIFMGWIIAWFYLRASATFDQLTKDILDRSDQGQGGG
jgi:uncharacterized membrane protein (DUF485 family)